MRFALILLTATVAIAGEFSTALGDAYPYIVSAVATDAAGNTYVTGSRNLGGPSVIYTGIVGSIGVSVTSVLTENYQPAGSDVFVTKLDPNGNLLFTDTFAGKGTDEGNAIAVDPSGNIYIGGVTTSSDFPLTKALQTQSNPTYGTGFIIKLSADGSTILYSTYFGGTLGGSSISSLATDSNGNLFVTGFTGSADFPHTTGFPFSPPATSNSGAILACISAAGDKLLFSGALVGGPIPVTGGNPQGTGGTTVSLDAAGNAYFTGSTGSSDLPTTPGVLQPTGSFTGFIARINAGTSTLAYLTYLPSLVYASAVDSAGNAFVAGYNTQGINAPYQLTVTKINPSATAILWTNNLNSSATGIESMAVDAKGNAWVTGGATALFPNANGWTTGVDFLVGLNATGTQFTYSALFPAGTVERSVAVDPSGLIHVAGLDGFVSAISPTTAPSMKIFGFGSAAAGPITARISPAEVISIYGPGIGPSTAASAAPTNGFYPTTFDGIQVTINGMNMPLLFVSANQINAVVPMEVVPGAGATVRVINGTTVSPAYPVWILAGSAMSFPAVLNQDNTANSRANPAKQNSVVTFYATGWQSSFSPLADGQVATIAQNECQPGCNAYSNTGVNGPTVTVLYAGPAPGIVAGVTQFNVHIGALPSPPVLTLFNFTVTGQAAISQSVWVTP